MNFELEPSRDLGLQHLLQNGLNILQGGDLGGERNAEVLDGLREIVSEADRGSEALRAQSLTFALDDAPAFEKFSLFFRYLQDSPEDLPSRLSNAKAVLERFEHGDKVTPAEKRVLEGLLRDLLQALERERAVAPLHAPREIHYH